MKIIVQRSAGQAVAAIVDFVAESLRAKPEQVLGLATGQTMESVYAGLVVRHREDGLDFSLCRTFNLDEYIGLAPDDPGSYHHYMRRRLFDHVNINPRNTHLPRGDVKDIDAVCKNYEAAIADAGGIDLQLLGIGVNGHIGFNEPWSSFASRTRKISLSPETIARNSLLFPSPELMPRQAITMGLATITASRRCLLLVTGKDKAGILARAIAGPVTEEVPASILQRHPDCLVVADPEAASMLPATGN